MEGAPLVTDMPTTRISSIPETPRKKRLDTALEAEGAEFLVLGHLLLNHIVANKAYSNTKDYDIIAVNPETKRAATVQVKSRWRTDANSFVISSVNADFVVLASLNRGPDAKGQGGEQRAPAFTVLPRSVAEAALSANRNGKISLRALPYADEETKAPFLDGWSLIRKQLDVDYKPFL